MQYMKVSNSYLLTRFVVVGNRFAKQAYARSRDAMQVCLYYVALGKSNILGALAKMARDEQNKVRGGNMLLSCWGWTFDSIDDLETGDVPGE